jgi:hypothetical protein
MEDRDVVSTLDISQSSVYIVEWAIQKPGELGNMVRSTQNNYDAVIYTCSSCAGTEYTVVSRVLAHQESAYLTADITSTKVSGGLQSELAAWNCVFRMMKAGQHACPGANRLFVCIAMLENTLTTLMKPTHPWNDTGGKHGGTCHKGIRQALVAASDRHVLSTRCSLVVFRSIPVRLSCQMLVQLS